jgi:outer membrane protein OmpA-like peptidoglycan-associated protein
MKKSNFFWVSYADLMTSLFFIMLVLYVITFVLLQSEMDKIEADSKKLKEIENVEKALQDLDKRYFEFDKINKRYKLKVDAVFHSGSDKITDIPLKLRKEIFLAGKALYEKINSIIKDNPDVDYLLVIEGNTQRINNNWITIPNAGYKLSYRRALALFNYWKSRGLDFREIGTQCEIIIAGSGYFGQSRNKEDENHNRRFTIQITSKVGKFIQSKDNE